jgi:hypothetical protein
MRKVQLYRNRSRGPRGKHIERHHLPYRQTLIWAGPIFIHIRPR